MKGKEMWLPLPQVDLVGNGFVRIENYLGILEFTDTRLKLKMQEMIYLLEGEQLVVRGVTKREIFVEGKVKNLKIITEPTE